MCIKEKFKTLLTFFYFEWWTMFLEKPVHKYELYENKITNKISLLLAKFQVFIEVNRKQIEYFNWCAAAFIVLATSKNVVVVLEFRISCL